MNLANIKNIFENKESVRERERERERASLPPTVVCNYTEMRNGF